MGTTIMYLRKSRADDPDQTVEEVLAKHETMLQEYALREFGAPIPEEDIYREVVSGESIDDRIEIKKVLARVEDPEVEAVLVVEPQRLSRGDLEDCGRLVNDLRYSYTLVRTLRDTYDLNVKRDRKYFQDELLRGNDFLEYYKEIQQRGREAAAKRGCYIASKAPYGYNRIKVGKDWTLEENEHADVVRWIFHEYTVEGNTPGIIAMKLNDRGIAPPWRAKVWGRETVVSILENIHYAGKVCYNLNKQVTVMEDGRRKKKQVKLGMDHEDVILAEGKHDGLISWETWEAAEARRATNSTPVSRGRGHANPLAGLMRCPKCGWTYQYRLVKGKYKVMECRTLPRCCRRLQYNRVYDAILYSLEHAELPNLKTKLANGEGDAAAIQRSLLVQLEKQMEEYKKQEETQYELLETGRYTPEVFDKRNKALREKMESLQKQIYETRTNLPEEVNFEEKIVALEEAIAAMKDPAATPKQVNMMLKAIVDRMECTVLDEGHEWGKTNFRLEIFLKL